jgi:FkbM family methyltransferase
VITPARHIYPGYVHEDVAFLKSYVNNTPFVGEDYYIDGFGVRTNLECVPFCDPTTLQIENLRLPVPDDGVHAEAIEYFALVDAINRAESRGCFSAVEIGAGWGPWIGMAGVVAQRHNFEEIKLVGVEADIGRFELLRRHLAANGLRPFEKLTGDAVTDRVFTRLFNGAVWTYDGNVLFPAAELADMGTAAVTEKSLTDYRGKDTKYINVSCLTLERILDGLGCLDFVHIDVQGAEFELVSSRINWMESKVRSCLISTHSRPIEGSLIDLLHSRGWQLLREKPCRVDWSKDKISLTGKTVTDGNQYWFNSKLV